MSNQTTVSDLLHYTGEEWLSSLEWGISQSDTVEYYGLTPDTPDSDLYDMAKAESEMAVESGCVVDITSLYEALKRVRDSL